MKCLQVYFVVGYIVLSGILSPCFSLLAGDDVEEPSFTWGGDFRFRIAGLSQVPTEADRNGGSNIADSRFLRSRTRIWANRKVNTDTTIRVRLSNEFRLYDQSRVNHTNPWTFPDEFIFDELYIDSKNLWNGRLSIRAGRQFLMYGTGRIFLETSPLDGSRTAFSNAFKVSIRLRDTHNLDLISFDNPSCDGIALHSSHADLVEWAEDGVALYGSCSAVKKLPFEYYYVYKNEKRDVVDGADVHLNTVGVRVMPVIGDSVTGNVEIATQEGSQGGNGIGGTMVDGFLTLSLDKQSPHKPLFKAGYYFLSGDKAGTGKNEEWHPVMSRWVQYSDFFLYAFIDGGGGHKVGYWTNLAMPWFGVAYTPSKKTSVDVKYASLNADQTDEPSFPGLGHNMGDLVTARFRYTINKTTSGQLNYEWFRPGDYYVDEMPCGSFFRAEITFSF